MYGTTSRMFETNMINRVGFLANLHDRSTVVFEESPSFAFIVKETSSNELMVLNKAESTKATKPRTLEKTLL